MENMSDRDDTYNSSTKGLERHERYRLKNMPKINAYGRHWRRLRRRTKLQGALNRAKTPETKQKLRAALAEIARLEREYKVQNEAEKKEKAAANKALAEERRKQREAEIENAKFKPSGAAYGD
jgi:hypothetical protein